VRLKAQVYRAHHPGWAFAPTSGAGAAHHGGRFNRTGRPALYTSLSWDCAWTEAQQGFPFKAQPVTIFAYDVDCEDVEDLADAATRARLGIAMQDLACAWEDLADRGEEPPSWAIAERFASRGVAGIVIPSFAPGATASMRNAVFWDWHADPPHQVRVVNGLGRLPRDRASWS
jgi:RES domain-containing protein